jgi:hypothetical protein
MTPDNFRFLVAVVVAVPVWWFTYSLIGGKWPQPLTGGAVTWGMRWRSFVAALVAAAVAGLAVAVTRPWSDDQAGPHLEAGDRGYGFVEPPRVAVSQFSRPAR